MHWEPGTGQAARVSRATYMRRRFIAAGVAAAVGLFLLWTAGWLDGMLVHVGLNYTDCATNVAGNTVCGDDLKRLRAGLRDLRRQTQRDLNPPTRAQQATVGHALVLTSGGTRLSVAPLRILDPAPVGQYDTPGSGRHDVAVEFRVVNLAATPYSGSISPEAITTTGRTAQDAIVTSGSCQSNGELGTLLPRAAGKVCEPYDLATSERLARIQITVSSTDPTVGNSIGVWSVP